jgi:hypothetical protein
VCAHALVLQRGASCGPIYYYADDTVKRAGGARERLDGQVIKQVCGPNGKWKIWLSPKIDTASSTYISDRSMSKGKRASERADKIGKVQKVRRTLSPAAECRIGQEVYCLGVGRRVSAVASRLPPFILKAWEMRTDGHINYAFSKGLKIT